MSWAWPSSVPACNDNYQTQLIHQTPNHQYFKWHWKEGKVPSTNYYTNEKPRTSSTLLVWPKIKTKVFSQLNTLNLISPNHPIHNKPPSWYYQVEWLPNKQLSWHSRHLCIQIDFDPSKYSFDLRGQNNKHRQLFFKPENPFLGSIIEVKGKD